MLCLPRNWHLMTLLSSSSVAICKQTHTTRPLKYCACRAKSTSTSPKYCGNSLHKLCNNIFACHTTRISTRQGWNHWFLQFEHCWTFQHLQYYTFWNFRPRNPVIVGQKEDCRHSPAPQIKWEPRVRVWRSLGVFVFVFYIVCSPVSRLTSLHLKRIHCDLVVPFSRMRSKGSRFTLGSGGWGCVRSTLRLCSQPPATVRNRPREVAMAVPLVSFAKGVTFGGFKRRVALFRLAGVALRDIQTCFV